MTIYCSSSLSLLDVTYYRQQLYRYRCQHAQALSCPTEKDLGFLLVDTNELKARLIPSPVRCLEVCRVACKCAHKPHMYMYSETSDSGL